MKEYHGKWTFLSILFALALILSSTSGCKNKHGTQFHFDDTAMEDSISHTKEESEISIAILNVEKGLKSSGQLEESLYVKMNKNLVKTIEYFILESRSFPIKMLGKFLIQDTWERQEQRWIRAKTWKKLLLLESSQTNYSIFSVNLGLEFINSILESIEEGLTHDAISGVLKASDYKLLIISGFGDIAVKLLKNGDCKNCPSIMELMEVAREFQEESFIEALFRDYGSIKGLKEVMKNAEFWFNVALVYTPLFFLKCQYHLNQEEKCRLLKMLTEWKVPEEELKTEISTLKKLCPNKMLNNFN